MSDSAVELTQLLDALRSDIYTALGGKDGRTTGKISSELGIAEETARNHIKAVLRALGARSRLEAVVAARHRGLL